MYSIDEESDGSSDVKNNIAEQEAHEKNQELKLLSAEIEMISKKMEKLEIKFKDKNASRFNGYNDLKSLTQLSFRENETQAKKVVSII